MSHRTWRKFSRIHILREKDPWEVARNAFEIALELALLGSVEEATRLFDLFANFSKDCKSAWSPGLYFAWEATGRWPDSVSAQERSPEALDKLEIERILWKRETHATDEGLDKLIAEATGEGRTDAWGHPQLRYDDLIAALDLAVYLDKKEKVDELVRIFADNFDLTWEMLSKSRHAWKCLKHGVLARAIGVDAEKLRDFQKEAFDTLKERLETGYRRVLKDLPMKDILDLCNENTLKNAVWEEMDIDPSDPPKTILHKGATADEIAALEKKLDHYLPDDYKEFLSVSNGTESLWNGFHGEPKLLGTDDVRITDATERQKEMDEASVNMGFYMSMSVKPKWLPLTHAIQVNDGSEDSKFVFLLTPEYVRTSGASFFQTLASLPLDEQAHVKKMMGYFYSGIEAASDLSWIVCVWSPQTLELANYRSWREYIEVLAVETANEDILDEKDAMGRLVHSQDIFAYQLR